MSVYPSQSESEPDERRGAQQASLLHREFHPSFFVSLHNILKSFSPAERLLLYLLSIVMSASVLWLLIDVNVRVSAIVPSPGGEIVEGAVGTPRFINPLLAISQVDQDLAALVFSGLMRSSNNTMVPDLAESYLIEDEGKKYVFRLREDAQFHDGAPITAEDILFTIALVQNPEVKSPRRADWDGVVAEAIDERTVALTLPQAYAPFLENTQLGIIPKHLWEDVLPAELPFHILNSNPIGSGPFEVDTIETDAAGLPTKYLLEPFDDFALGAPHLKRITFVFFANQDLLLSAYDEEKIDSFAGVPGSQLPARKETTHVEKIESTRIFGIFFNQNRAAVLSDAAVRRALDTALDRDLLIKTVLAGYGTPLADPIPPSLLHGTTTPPYSIEAARAILEKGGWTFAEESGTWSKDKQVLSFALATADTPELVLTAEEAAARWRELGIPVDVQVYPLTEFSVSVLRPRNYDAVLFGEVVGHSLDLFAFWHSSQRNDPGLNLALYTNTKTDRILASARTETSRNEREELYQEFIEIIRADVPAVFLYAPEFVYAHPNGIHGTAFGTLTTPSERFMNVHEWYTDTERVWSFFNN